MTTKHTAGPFRATQLNGYNDLEPFFVWSDGINAAVAHVFKRTEQGDDDRDTQAANARLLAAAPDMAEAVKNLLGLVETYQKNAGTVECNGYGLNPVADTLDTIQAARAALEKAGR